MVIAEPTSFQRAVMGDAKFEWEQAIKAEYDSIVGNAK
jgi:hypothetical protein